MDNLSTDRENFRNYEKMTGSFILTYKEEYQKKELTNFTTHPLTNQTKYVCIKFLTKFICFYMTRNYGKILFIAFLIWNYHCSFFILL